MKIRLALLAAPVIATAVAARIKCGSWSVAYETVRAKYLDAYVPTRKKK